MPVPAAMPGRNQGSGVRGGGDGKKETEIEAGLLRSGQDVAPGVPFPLFHLVMTVATVCVPTVAGVPLSLRCVISSSRLPWRETGGGPSLSLWGQAAVSVCRGTPLPPTLGP